MTTVPPPHGMTEVDYEAIEAAVTETVRGRWFLAEFARRNRLAETRQILDAITRIELAVAAGQLANPALPSADPSIRLLIQRIKEVAGQLGTVAFDMRESGVDERFVAAVDLQARAVAGMMRGGAPAKETPPAQEVKPADVLQAPAPPPKMLCMPRAELPPMLAVAPSAVPQPSVAPDDPRLETLSGLDGMTLAKKLTFFA